MKKLLLPGFALLLGLTAQAQTFILPTAAERLGPSMTGTPSFPSSSYLLDQNVNQISNANYNSVVAGHNVKIAGWSNGSTGGVVWGYDDASGLPVVTGAQIMGGIDVQVGILERTTTSPNLYAIVSFYSLSRGAYVYELYTWAASSITLVDTKVLMTTSYNRLSMDVYFDAKGVAFTWSDGTDVYTAVGKIDAALDKLNFSPYLASPAIKITGGTSHKTLPDVAFMGYFPSGVGSPGTDSIYYAFYDDSSSHVTLLKSDASSLYFATSSTMSLPVKDYNPVTASPVMVELDAPDVATASNLWGYTYADGYVKVRHQARSFGPVTATINNGSLAKGPVAMSSTGADIHPVIAYSFSSEVYSLGWTTTRATSPYAYPHTMAMVYTLMDCSGSQDTIRSKKDYQLINVFPTGSPIYVPPVLSFATITAPSSGSLYVTHARINPSYLPWGEIVHQNHKLSTLTSFRLAETEKDPQLSVAPNPSTHSFQLIIPAGMDASEEIKVSVTDMAGRIVARCTGTAAVVNTQLKTASEQLQSGTYVIVADHGTQHQSFKVQKLAE